MHSQASTFTGLGLAALVCGVMVVPACDSGDDTGTNGGSGSGGSHAGTSGGGSSNAGSSSGGNGNAGTSNGGTAGSTDQVVTTCAGVMPAAASITDFGMTPAAGAMYEWGSAEKGTMDFWGGTFNYPVALEVTVADGALTAAGNVAEYAGFGLYLQNCADASSFEGVRFKISGNPPMGKLRFALQTNQNEWATGLKGSCLAADAKKFIDCVHPSVEVSVTEAATSVEITWAELGAGKPAASTTTDGSDVIGLQWVLPWAEKAAPYDVSVTIDDVEFIGVGSGAGGAGAGGAAGDPGLAGAGGA